PADDPKPCRSPEEAGDVLDRAGLARFHAKAARFEGDFTVVDPAQALWSGLLEALGYSANARPFRRLADRLPVPEAMAAARLGGRTLSAALFGEAGLLPHQRGIFGLESYADDLERAWRATGRYGPIAPLEWRMVGVRPGNSPVRRVAAAAPLVA